MRGQSARICHRVSSMRRDSSYWSSDAGCPRCSCGCSRGTGGTRNAFCPRRSGSPESPWCPRRAQPQVVLENRFVRIPGLCAGYSSLQAHSGKENGENVLSLHALRKMLWKDRAGHLRFMWSCQRIGRSRVRRMRGSFTAASRYSRSRCYRESDSSKKAETYWRLESAVFLCSLTSRKLIA